MVLFVFTVAIADAQRWKRYRYDAILGIGASNFLGELGGANQIGTDYIKDLEIKMTKPVFHLGIRYRLDEYIANKTSINFGWVAGDDKLTEEPYRQNRNLHFRAPILEFATQFEFSWKREQIGHKYRLRGVKGQMHIEIYTYGFIGVAGFWFNPRGQYDGKWYSLQPLGTEGQTLLPSRKKYSRINVSIPMGLGFKYAIDRKWSIGFELGGRKTFTDYIDDVSSTYYDNNEIYNEVGPIAAYFADPSLGNIYGQTAPGEQRGDRTDFDTYIFAVFSVNYKLRTGRNNLPSF